MRKSVKYKIRLVNSPTFLISLFRVNELHDPMYQYRVDTGNFQVRTVNKPEGFF
jgi:hypothetical protein